MLNKIIEKIRNLAKDTIVYPPKSQEELQRFLMAWYCSKYNIPMTSDTTSKLDFETLLLEFYLFNRWKDVEEDIKSGKFEAEAQAGEDEEWFKQEMGEEYNEDTDYLMNPSDSEKSGDTPEDIEEDFSSLGEITDYGDK